MRLYELVLILKPSLKEADRKKLLTTVKEWLKDVKITKEDDWGQKALAYAIKHEESGHYYMLGIESDPEAGGSGKGGVPKDFEQRIIRQDNILRHLMLRTK
ncbi:MAG TPA: 30S ribosomal protein S6 [Candidatus Saccharimonadales bacterium]|nr:30S ribosomal protein S6 [Candidatus Saccharimonadales bacterium]